MIDNWYLLLFCDKKAAPQVPTFTHEQMAKFEARYKKGYDVEDPIYLTWKSINHPSPATTTSSHGSTASACTVATAVVSVTTPTSSSTPTALTTDIYPAQLTPNVISTCTSICQIIREKFLANCL